MTMQCLDIRLQKLLECAPADCSIVGVKKPDDQIAENLLAGDPLFYICFHGGSPSVGLFGDSQFTEGCNPHQFPEDK